MSQWARQRREQPNRSNIATVAIVEDNEDLANLISNKIQKIRSNTIFQTMICPDYLSAISVLLKNSIDIFIVDISIPKSYGDMDYSSNGKRLISAIAENSDAAIVVFSGVTDRFDPAEFFELGAVDIIDKSIGEEYLSKNLVLCGSFFRRIELC